LNIFTQTGALRARWAVLVVLVVAIAISVVNVAYTGHLQRQSDQRWCPLLIIADRPNPARPAQTPDEIEARRVLHQLRLDLRCGDK
jgi:hypothetical protein